MRIGLVRYKYTPFGGAEVFLKRFMQVLVKKGHSVDLFTSEWEPIEGVTIHKLKVRGPSFLRPIFFAWALERKLEKVTPDVILSLEKTHCIDIYRAGDGCHREWLALRGARGSGFKAFALAFNPNQMTQIFMEEQLYKSTRLKKVVANSNMVKNDLIRHYGLPEDKICVIYNGIEPIRPDHGGSAARSLRAKLRSEIGAKDSTVVILFVGSGFERKGLGQLIGAFAKLSSAGKAPDAKIVVVGKGRPDRYMKEARAAGIADKVEFLGARTDALDYYQAADIFALPSLYEPFSNACLEALQAGLPVVTTSRNGAAEILNEASGSVVVDPYSIAELAEKLLIFFDTKKREEAGPAARAIAAQFTMERTVEGFLELIEEIKR